MWEGGKEGGQLEFLKEDGGREKRGEARKRGEAIGARERKEGKQEQGERGREDGAYHGGGA
jgi:hypothetical protein